MTTTSHFTEHKDWSTKHPRGPVTFDGQCITCGFALSDKPLLTGIGLSIEGDGRKLALVRWPDTICIRCSTCHPGIK